MAATRIRVATLNDRPVTLAFSPGVVSRAVVRIFPVFERGET